MRRRALAALAVLVGVISLSACQTRRPAPPAAAPSIQGVDCAAWRTLSPGQRAALLTRFQAFFRAPVDGPGGRGPALAAADATRLFDSYCGMQFAGAFKLYKLYGRAAAFA